LQTWDAALFLQVLTSPLLVAAAWTTVWVATVAQAAGTAIGVLVAPMMMSRARLPRLVAWLYLWVFRGTPLLAQILFFYAVLPLVGLRFDVVTTGLLALSINEGARMAEIVRGGLLSVPAEQREAATALGLRRVQAFLLVVLPQAARAIVPPLGNNYSYMIKATSLLSVISFAELLRTSQQLAQSTARPLEIYAAAALWYLAIVSVLTLLQRLLERRMARADTQRRTTRADASPPDAGRPRVAATLPGPAGSAPPLIEARGLVRRLGGTLALDGADLDVRRGEVVVVIGPSGSGKSTLLRCLNHLETPDAGVVRLDGETVGVVAGPDGAMRPRPEAEIDRQRRRLGMVFQRFHLFAHLTVLRNVAIGPERSLGLPRAEAEARARGLLARLGLADKLDARPAALSGGQRQRVAIARALAMEPLALLFDEPTSALDPELVQDVLAAMRGLAAAGTTMVVVTHEIGFARAVADRVVMMEAGRIVEAGPPDRILSAPTDPRTRRFVAQLG
jgi:polar amino acid transport system permease protein